MVVFVHFEYYVFLEIFEIRNKISIKIIFRISIETNFKNRKKKSEVNYEFSISLDFSITSSNVIKGTIVILLNL